jgi:hypothetical protein
VSLRRWAIVVVVLVALAAAGWAGRWWWNATHPRIPADTTPGWVPAVVIAAAEVRFDEPFGVAAAADGSLYIADAGDAHAVWHVSGEGRARLLAGGRRGFADGIGPSAAFATPSHLSLSGDGALYVADTGNHAVRRIAPDGSVTTVAGDGHAGTGEGPHGRLRGPVGVAAGPGGRVFVADTYNDRIVEVRDGAIHVVAGGAGPGLIDGDPHIARFDTPAGLVALPDGSLVIADTGNDVLRRIAPGGTVSTLASYDPTGGADLLWRPVGVVAASGGRLYVTDSRARVVEMAADGPRRVLAGGMPGYAAGLGTSALFREPAGIAVTSTGRVVVADSGNRLVRVLDLPLRLGAWAPASPHLGTGFDRGCFSRLPLLWPLDPQRGPHEIAGTVGEPRGNPGGDGRERFHAGVDIRTDHGAFVRAVRDGTVSSVLASSMTGTLNESLAVGPIVYVHVRVGRDRLDTPLVPWAMLVADPLTPGSRRPGRVRVPRGTFIRAGTLVGSANRFRHVHLNAGPSGEEGNALTIGLPGVVDTIAPVIVPGGITVTDLSGQPVVERDRRRVVVRGPVRIVVEAYDRMDDSPPRRRLGLYRVGYQVVTPDGQPAGGFNQPHIAITFDRLPAADDAPRVLYAPGSGIPFYGARVTRFKYVVTSKIDGERVVEAPWHPELAPGDYLIRVLAGDAAGNMALAGRDLPISIAAR